MKKIVIFSALYLLSPLANADPHSHDGRLHDHPYPAAGLQHRHGEGGLGVAESSNQKPAASPQKTTAEKKDGYYYYSLVGQEMKVENYKGAVSLLKKSCNLNYGLACAKLGLFYGAGRGVPVDNSIAMKYFSKSCNLNNGDGCYNYGLMSRCKGVVSSRNYGECSLASMRNSRDYFINMACKAGQAVACKMISDKYPFDPSTVLFNKTMTESYNDAYTSQTTCPNGKVVPHKDECN